MKSAAHIIGLLGALTRPSIPSAALVAAQTDRRTGPHPLPPVHRGGGRASRRAWSRNGALHLAALSAWYRELERRKASLRASPPRNRRL